MPNETTMFPIGHLAERLDLRPSAIHFYEKMGLLRPARRSPSAHRVYDAEDIRRLELIIASRELGCTLAEIQEVIQMNTRRTSASPSTLQAYQALLRRKRRALRRLERAPEPPNG